MNKTKKMQTERLEQNELHKQLLECFGTVKHAGHALGFSKQAVYDWINGKCSQFQRNRMDSGFAQHRLNVSKLKAMLIKT